MERRSLLQGMVGIGLMAGTAEAQTNQSPLVPAGLPSRPIRATCL
jgi:hypothetical protein